MFRDTLWNGGELQGQVVDRGAAETSATVQAAQELSVEMAATLGRTEEFHSDQEEWSQREEQLGYSFEANGIAEEAKK